MGFINNIVYIYSYLIIYLMKNIINFALNIWFLNDISFDKNLKNLLTTIHNHNKDILIN